MTQLLNRNPFTRRFGHVKANLAACQDGATGMIAQWCDPAPDGTGFWLVAEGTGFGV